jgi:mRNA-degrading endonuclease RelE of RelBE toxin-antitoxin system
LTEEYKHTAEIRGLFLREVKKLDIKTKERVYGKIDELLKGFDIGKTLKGPLRECKSVRIGKYRLIYSNREKCKVVLLTINPRESVYYRIKS